MGIVQKLKNKVKQNDKLSVIACYKAKIEPACATLEKLLKGAPEDTVVFLCPYVGTGDVYLASLYIKSYAKNNGYDNYVVTVIGGANYNIAKLFQFERIAKISQSEADNLVCLSTFLGRDNTKIRIMHHHAPQTYSGILENMRNYNGLDFADLFVNCVFHLDKYEDKQGPTFDYESPEIQNLFIENKLEPGRTVILAPYANTLQLLPWWVWINIADKLKARGYVVCTNCGSPNEPPVDGTIPLFFPFKIAVPVLEKCGHFIGIRSGFCDIISSAKCNKVILYQPYNFWGEGTNYDYFSLNKIGFCDDAFETEHHGVEFLELIDTVMTRF